MKVQEIDQNLAVSTTLTEPDLVWFNARTLPFSIHGLLYDEAGKQFLRLPEEVARTVSEGVFHLNRHTAGGRVRFRTNSSYIAIRAVMPPPSLMSHMPLTGSSGFDLYRNVDGRETYYFTFVPPGTWEDGYSSGISTSGDLTDYTINFPLYDRVFDLYIGLKKDSVLEAAPPYRNALPVVFYGNSITQGGCASRPGNSYQGFLSRRFSMDFINLGFSGSGKGEPEMAEYIASLPMSLLVMDYDCNSPSPETLLATHAPFIRTVRQAHPNLPILCLSHSGKYIRNKAWGTLEERRAIIRASVENAVAAGDRNIYFLDGGNIFSDSEWDACTVDGAHPNDLGFLRFAEFLTPFFETTPF